MFKRLIFLITLFVSFIGTAQEVKEIRIQYLKAVENSEITTKLDGDLATISSAKKPVLLAYRGAVLTLKAKFAKGRKDKKDFFKEGVSLIESAIKAEPSNIEIHYIRLSVQENSPKFLGYNKKTEEDKQLIINNLEAISSKELKTIIKEFVLNSENFNDTEKQSLN